REQRVEALGTAPARTRSSGLGLVAEEVGSAVDRTPEHAHYLAVSRRTRSAHRPDRPPAQLQRLRLPGLRTHARTDGRARVHTVRRAGRARRRMAPRELDALLRRRPCMLANRLRQPRMEHLQATGERVSAMRRGTSPGRSAHLAAPEKLICTLH